MLSRNYGMQLRIRFKQKLAGSLRTVLEEGEDVYHLPGTIWCCGSTVPTVRPGWPKSTAR
ncbi:Cyclic di-GMP phosphodiesterase YfgF [Serratia fonticola]|uniref:Cyclic di-GMP phosphodiesterase YfgF n=1 Tax=Serratia fonticola TaxID=47917 RepID=A0A4V6KQF5_SERFO|nr:Cyclic di-GMP phosphodiesterase YfgF [Serratia fonticola]